MSKPAFTRLLDLITGWAEYVENQEAEYPDSLKSAAIHDLYQEFGAFAEKLWDGTLEQQEIAARLFIETRVIPLLLTKE